MRETRQSGSEGGGALIRSPYLYHRPGRKRRRLLPAAGGGNSNVDLAANSVRMHPQ